MKFVLFNSARPRRFDHIPIYYDERKERLRKLENAAKNEKASFNPDDLRGKFVGEWRKNVNGSASEERRKSNIRVALLIGLLVMLAYYFMQSDMSILERLYK